MAAVIAVAWFSSTSNALEMGFFHDAPFTQLNADEVTKFRAFVIETLNSAADGATAQWTAPQTIFKSTLTMRKSVMDGKYRCRQARIESASKDRKGAGEYWFCKAEGSEWTYRTPGGNAKPTSK